MLCFHKAGGKEHGEAVEVVEDEAVGGESVAEPGRDAAAGIADIDVEAVEAPLAPGEGVVEIELEVCGEQLKLPWSTAVPSSWIFH